MIEARTAMNDYRRIRVLAAGCRKLHAQETARVLAAQKRWLSTKLGMPFPGRNVVIGHIFGRRRPFQGRTRKMRITNRGGRPIKPSRSEWTDQAQRQQGVLVASAPLVS